MLKNKKSILNNDNNMGKQAEVAYFLWLKNGCPESIEEVAYFSMLQSGRPHGANRAIWNETKRRLESRIRKNMGLPEAVVKTKKIPSDVVKKSATFAVMNKAEVKKVSEMVPLAPVVIARMEVKKPVVVEVKDKSIKKVVAKKLDKKNVKKSIKKIVAKKLVKTDKIVSKKSVKVVAKKAVAKKITSKKITPVAVKKVGIKKVAKKSVLVTANKITVKPIENKSADNVIQLAKHAVKSKLAIKKVAKKMAPLTETLAEMSSSVDIIKSTKSSAKVLPMPLKNSNKFTKKVIAKKSATARKVALKKVVNK